METKVWNALAAALAKKADIKGSWLAADADLPAFGMSADEADAMARVLGGVRPTKEQWDKAAGFDPKKPPAAVIGGSKPAVNRRTEGPRSVKEKLDVSVFDILDMGGNGTELTRDRTDALDDKLVILRGQRHTAPYPLQFADLEEQQTTPQVQFYKAHSPFTGFRVVIEPQP
jgi:formylglycine-generating enzyme required for sulfatase activity